MKNSKEKEHRISNLKEMINNMNKSDQENNNEEVIEEDAELIDYLNEDQTNYEDLEINDEFIYHPGDEKNYAINLEENPIDEDFIINTPVLEDNDETSEELENEDFAYVFSEELSENFDNLVNAKIGKTPILAILSSILGMLLIIIAGFIFQSRSDRIIDNVVSGENTFIVVILVIIGSLLLIYGILKIFHIKTPFDSMKNNINSIDNEFKKENKTSTKKEEDTKKIIPKSKIPLDKESYKIGEFNMDELKNKLKKPTNSKDDTNDEEINDINVSDDNKDEDLNQEEDEYEQLKLESESIDDIFAEVDDIEDIPIISIDSKEDESKKEKK